MSDVDIRVKGAAQLSRTMRAAGRDIGNMDAATDRVAADLAQSARGRAPRRTGRLSRSIVGQTPRPNNAQVVVLAPYGVYVEHGTRFMAAQPFLTVTLQAEQGQIVQTYKAEVDKALRTVHGA